MNKFFISLLYVVLMPVGLLAQSEISISDDSSEGSIAIVADGAAIPILVSEGDAEVVGTVAQCVASDIEAVTGVKPQVSTSTVSVGVAVIAGTLGSSEFVDNLAADGKIDADAVAGKWETYGLQIVDNPADNIGKALVVFGSSPRGTAYGLFELSRQMGVSPWIWWADVAPMKKQELYACGEKTISKEPSVKYRGIFINDEDFALQPWAAKGIDKQYNNIGPNTYAKVMELLKEICDLVPDLTLGDGRGVCDFSIPLRDDNLLHCVHPFLRFLR